MPRHGLTMETNERNLGLVYASLREKIINALCKPLSHFMVALGISISIFKLHSTQGQNILSLFWGKRKRLVSNYFVPK
jgi:hypothetical protein